MQLSLTTVIFGLAAFAAAMPGEVLMARQNGGRPVPSGTCCVANTSLKQDACQANGGAGRCVPGGNACGSRLSCVAQANLVCDANVQERSNTLCRAKAPGGGLFDGGNIIQSLAQAKVN